MKRIKFFVSLLILSVLFSCSPQKKQEEQIVSKSDFSTAKQHSKIENLHPKTTKEFESWKEYEDIKAFVPRFFAISPNDALSNSKEFDDLIKRLQDSVQPKILNTSAFNARVNLLRNESLRLYDMSSISSIKAEEVNHQVEKLLAAFSSVNAKMNTVIRQKSLDEEIGNDSITRNRLPKKSTTKKKRSELEL